MSPQSNDQSAISDSMDGDIPNFDQLASLIRMQEQLQKQFQDGFREILDRLSFIESQVAQPSKASDRGGPPPAMDWEAKKQAIYAEHGMPNPASHNTAAEAHVSDSNTRDGDMPPQRFNAANHPCLTSEAGPSESSTSKTRTLDAETLNQVNELKSELHEKLRMAELDLSIGRAKIIQETALLEEQRRELEKTTPTPSQITRGATDEKKPSILDRLSRHMKSGNH